jgi:hypothetical protein
MMASADVAVLAAVRDQAPAPREPFLLTPSDDSEQDLPSAYAELKDGKLSVHMARSVVRNQGPVATVTLVDMKTRTYWVVRLSSNANRDVSRIQKIIRQAGRKSTASDDALTKG